VPFEEGQAVRSIRLAGRRFGGYRIQWTADGKGLIYSAQQDGTVALLKQSLDGGPPETIADFDQEGLIDFGYSSDGQLLAITRGKWQHDIVLISDLSQH
jgi:hypothetical protein